MVCSCNFYFHEYKIKKSTNERIKKRKKKEKKKEERYCDKMCFNNE